MNGVNANKEKTFSIKRRRLWLSILLSFLTFPIYMWVWLYLICRDSDKISYDNSKFKCKKFFWAALVPTIFGIFLTITAIILLNFEVQIQVVTENFISTAYLIIDFNIFVLCLLSQISGFCLFIAGVINLYILLFKIGKKIDGHPVYYIIFAMIAGIWIVDIFAQDLINQFEGDYQADEKPCWFHVNNKAQSNLK